MNEIVRLPKNACINLSGGLPSLNVKNHRVLNKDGIFDWLMRVIYWDGWNKALSQMIQQGFKLDGVIEQCINEVNNPVKLAEIVWRINCHRHMKGISRQNDVMLVQNGMPIETHAKRKLRICKNWNDLYHMIEWDTGFIRNVQGQTVRGGDKR